VVGKIDVVMTVMPLVMKMECLVVSFCLRTYYLRMCVGQKSYDLLIRKVHERIVLMFNHKSSIGCHDVFHL
jgi:hypothetical protein